MSTEEKADKSMKEMMKSESVELMKEAAIPVITKGLQLKKILQPKVEALEPGESFISIRDICRQYGVSIYTAKSALNYFVEHGMLEHRQGSGTYRTNPVNYVVTNIALMSSHDFDPFTNLYYGEITKSAVDAVHECDHGLLLLGKASDLPQENFVPFLRHRRVVGVFLMGVFSEKFLRLVEASGFPAVLSETPAFSTALDYVSVESPDDSYGVMEYLLNLGHRRIGFIDYPEGDEMRKGSYLRAMEAYGIEADPRWQVRAPKGDMEYGAGAMKKLLDRAPEVTAVFCKNDTIAIGALTYLRSLGKRIPEDISLVGFDGLPLSQVVSPPLTTVKLDRAGVGKKLAETLYARINDPSRSQQVVQLRGEFVEGGSCRRVD